MPRFRFPTFGLFEPIGLFDAWLALERLKAMVRRSAADEAANDAHRRDGDKRIAPAQLKPSDSDRRDRDHETGSVRSPRDAEGEEGRR
jgi:hypothetical protein